jgi:hypothetical protein
MQGRRLIFAPSATHLASSSEKPIHPRLSTWVCPIEFVRRKNFKKSSLLLLPAREKKLRSLHLQPAAYRN